MTFITPLLFVGLLGALFLLVIFRSAPIRFFPWFVLSLCLPIGFSISSLLIFISYLVHARIGPLVSMILAIGLVIYLLIKLIYTPSSNQSINTAMPSNWIKKTQTLWLSHSRTEKILFTFCVVLWLFCLVRLTSLFHAMTVNTVYGGWDARFFWNVKASFYFRSPEEWRNMFSSLLSWAHPDYPLLVPGAVAWGWNWTGHELQVWPAIVAGSFILSMALMIAWYLSSVINIKMGLIASAFFMSIGSFIFWSSNQYADVPLSFFMTASGLAALLAFRSKNKSLFFLAGWLAGCSAWTKNEGLFFVAWLTSASTLLCFLNKKSFPHWKTCLFYLALGLSLPVLATFTLKSFLAQSGDYLGSGRGLGTYFQSIFMDWPKTSTILKSFPAYMLPQTDWNGLWILFFSACFFYGVTPRARQDFSGILGGLACLILFGYFVVLHTSPHNVVWQIQTALQRLLLHAGGLALIFTFEVYGRMMRSARSENPSSLIK